MAHPILIYSCPVRLGPAHDIVGFPTRPVPADDNRRNTHEIRVLHEPAHHLASGCGFEGSVHCQPRVLPRTTKAHMLTVLCFLFITQFEKNISTEIGNGNTFKIRGDIHTLSVPALLPQPNPVPCYDRDCPLRTFGFFPTDVGSFIKQNWSVLSRLFWQCLRVYYL